MRKPVTMSEIAQKLNVSTVTVSKALGGKEGVSDEIRAKIKQVAKELGYHYKVSKVSPRNGLTYNIGIIIAERFISEGSSFYWKLYKRISDELMKWNYYTVFEILKFTDENNAEVTRMFTDKKVDGIMVLGQVNKKYYNMIKSLSIPVVFVDFYEKDVTQNFVVTDNYYSMYLLTSYLIDMGHSDIGFIGNIKATSSIQDRYLGYIKALIENNIDIDKCKKWYIADRNDNGEYTGFDLPEELPTAFVCNCDKVAYDLIYKLDKKGLTVPDDISIVGFDNYSYSFKNKGIITTVEVDMKTMAQISVDMIMKKINNVKVEKGIKQVEGKIVLKSSVKKLI